MASGSFNVNTSNGYIKGLVEWSSVADQDNNKSIVTATFKISRTNTGYTTWGRGTFYLNINGVQKTNGDNFTFTHNSNTLVVTHTVEVNHELSGEKSIVISASGTHSQFSVNSTSNTVALDYIPNASKITLSKSSLTLGESIDMNIEKADPSFTHTLRYKVGTSAETTIVYNINNFYKWNVPIDLANHITKSGYATVTIYCNTYDGSTYKGTRTTSFVAHIPSSVLPYTNNILVSEIDPVIAPMNLNKFVKDLSQLNIKVRPEHMTLPYSATLKQIDIYVNYKKFTGTDVSVGRINMNVDNFDIYVEITDSRNRKTTAIYNYPLLKYNAPEITELTVLRADANGTLNDNGTYARVNIKGVVIPLMSGTSNKNSYSIKIFSKLREETYFNEVANQGGFVSENMSYEFLLFEYLTIRGYDFKIEVKDRFYTTISTVILPSNMIALALGKEGIGVGKVHENGALDVKGDIYVNNVNLDDKYLTADDDTYFTGANMFAGTSRFFAKVTTNNVDITGDITSVKGYKNVGRRASYDWYGTVPVGYIDLNHNLGYPPIPQAYGGNGSANLAYEIINDNTLRVKFWSASGTGWTGRILLW